MGDVSAKELSDLKARLQPALVECLEVGGPHEGPLLKRGRGSTLTEPERAVLDAHLETCPNCQLRCRALVDEHAAHAARDEEEKSTTFERYVETAKAASTPRGLAEPITAAVDTPTSSPPKPSIPSTATLEILKQPQVPFRRRVFAAVTGGVGLALAAGLAFLFFRPPPPVAIEAVDMRGQVASTMGPTETPAARPDPAEAPPRKGQATGTSYAPSGRFGITVRLTKKLDQGQDAPKLLAFFERGGRLHRIPEQHLTRPSRDPRWASLLLDVPVGAVFGAEAGPRRIFFASTYGRDAEDLEGRTPEEALGMSGVRWAQRTIEIVAP